MNDHAKTFAERRDAMLAERGTSARRHVHIDRAALLAVGASEDLAIDVAALRSPVALASVPTGAATMRAAVGVVSIEGALAKRAYFAPEICAFVDGYDYITERLKEALDDDAVDAVVVRIDSPGGDVPGLEEASKRMASAIRASGKPVVVYADEAVLSAAYWLASGLATDGIFAPDCGRIGCIGVIGAIVSEARALDEAGIDVVIIAEPEGKAEGHPALPISKEAVERSRSRIRTLGARFFDHVAATRGIEAKAVKDMAGAYFLADEAKARGLIDGVQSFEATVALAAEKGRARRLEQEKQSMEKEEQARLQTFEKSALESTGGKTLAEHLGKVEGLKANAGKYDELKAKYDVLVAKGEADAKERAESELVAVVDQAVAEGRLEPARKDAFLEKARKHGGKDFAEAALEDAKPIAANPGAKGGPAPIVPAVVPKVETALGELFAKTGIAPEDYAAAQAAGMV